MSSHKGGDHHHSADCHHEDKGKKTGVVLAPGTHDTHHDEHCQHGHDEEKVRSLTERGVFRDYQEHGQIRKGLAANPDNHFNQKCAAEGKEHGQECGHEHLEGEHAKAHTHARQGHAAHPDNQQH